MILKRISSTESQTRKQKYERWLNVDKTFELQKPSAIIGKHILLIDDVLTTGATIESCAQELLNISDVKVSIATVAVAV